MSTIDDQRFVREVEAAGPTVREVHHAVRVARLVHCRHGRARAVRRGRVRRRPLSEYRPAAVVDTTTQSPGSAERHLAEPSRSARGGDRRGHAEPAVHRIHPGLRTGQEPQNSRDRCVRDRGRRRGVLAPRAGEGCAQGIVRLTPAGPSAGRPWCLTSRCPRTLIRASRRNARERGGQPALIRMPLRTSGRAVGTVAR